jgi:hypothetical protein
MIRQQMEALAVKRLQTEWMQIPHPVYTAYLSNQSLSILHRNCVFVSYNSQYSVYFLEQEQLIFNGDGFCFMINKSKFVKYYWDKFRASKG